MGINNKVGIYKITSPSGKIYIGQSWDIEGRFKRYKRLGCKPQIKLYSSLEKHGCENHKFEIIHEFHKLPTQDDLNDYETKYWQQYRSEGSDMLNIREPGSKGRLSEETKQKLRNKPKYNLGIKQSPETVEKRVSKTRGMKRSVEQRKEISERRKGMKFSEETKLKMKMAKLGKKRSKESILKQSQTLKKYWENIIENGN